MENEYRIPKAFYSFETRQPFEQCIECRRYLLDDETEYLIEKAIRNYRGYRAKDVVFDYAICMSCAQELRKQISSDSMITIYRYFWENTEPEKRRSLMEGDPSQNVQKCLIKEIGSEDCQAYQIHAHCKGKVLSMENPPYMISDRVMDELSPLLSTSTKDELDGFFKKHFSPDPSWMEPDPKLVLI